MERQTMKCMDLYRWCHSPGPPITINAGTIEIQEDAPADGEIGVAVAKLTYGHSAGVSRMQA
jgi:hypothetical protein